MSERDPATTSRIMASIPSKDTKPELLLRKALWREGLRYRINYEKLKGKPDIVFPKYRLVVFVDGDFWHGHNWALRGMSSLEEELSGYSKRWQNKIMKNVHHDEEVNMALKAEGWTVLRIWESDIKNDLAECVRIVKESIFDIITSE